MANSVPAAYPADEGTPLWQWEARRNLLRRGDDFWVFGGPLFVRSGKVIGVNLPVLKGLGSTNRAVPVRYPNELPE